MHCDELHGLLAGLVVDDLPPAQRELVQLHMARCADCQTLYTGLIKTQAELASLGDDYHPDLSARISQRIRAHQTRHRLFDRVTRALKVAGTVAAVGLVIGSLVRQAPILAPADPSAQAGSSQAPSPGEAAGPGVPVGPRMPAVPGDHTGTGERTGAGEPTSAGEHTGAGDQMGNDHSTGRPPVPVYHFSGSDWQQIDLVSGAVRTIPLPSGVGQADEGVARAPKAPQSTLEHLLRHGFYLPDPTQPFEITRLHLAVQPEEQEELLASPLLLQHGTQAWVIRNEWLTPDQGGLAYLPRFAVDRIDLTTGTIHRERDRKEGSVQQALLSPNGGYLYLLANLEGQQFIKLVESKSGRLVTAYQLRRPFGPTTSLLLAPDGTTLHVVEEGRWLTLDLVTGKLGWERESEEITPIAVLSPDSRSLLSARPGGGLALWQDDASQPLLQTEGPLYSNLLWRGDCIYGSHATGIDLIHARDLGVELSYPMPAPGPLYQP